MPDSYRTRRDTVREAVVGVCSCTVTVLILLLTCFLHPKAARAQAPPSRIHGVVNGVNGKGIPGIRVTLDRSVSSVEREIKKTTSTSNGSFAFDHLAPGSYTVKADCPICELPPDISFDLEAGQNMGVTLVLNRSGIASAPGSEASATASPGPAAGKKTAASLGGAAFDQNPVFKAAPYSNPEAGGGYSDSASAGTNRMVREYLAPQQIGTAPGATARDGYAIQQAAQANPTEDHLNRWGNYLLGQRQFPQAAIAFDEAVKRYPRAVSLRLGFGIALSSEGKYKAAVEQLVAATDLAPDDPEPYLLLGQAAVLERAPDAKASERLKRFADLDPHNAQALYYYAMSLWAEMPVSTDRARLNPIETLLRSASTLDPDLGQARLELGILYEQEGRDAEAVREYQAAAHATPALAAAHYRLSQAYLRSGNKTAAQKEMELYHQAQK